jgi:hypothetical protein
MEVFAAAGAKEVALPPNGRIKFPKLNGGATAYWVGEAAATTWRRRPAPVLGLRVAARQHDTTTYGSDTAGPDDERDA